jgi:SRSO17 transposase
MLEMERRFRERLDELLADAEVYPCLLRRTLSRLETFLEPFTDALVSPEQRTNAHHYVSGLLSDLRSKDIESIAYLHDRERQGLQKFIGQVLWDHRPLLSELARQVGDELGEADGVLVFDPSSFAKKGTQSVGVQRQWCGRLGKVENCQVGVYLGYVSRQDHALVDFRLYLPKEWTGDRKRMNKAGVPKGVRFRTRHELALEMLDEQGGLLPHRWVAGDDEMGRSSWFRRELRTRGESYLLAVPSNTLVRDLVSPDPPYSGHGRRRRTPFVRAAHWRAGLAEDAWETIDVRDGEKGPLVVQAAWTAVQAKAEGNVSDVVESLVVFREQQGDGTWKHDYLLSDVIRAEPLAEFARVYKAEHRVEESLKRAKSEAGLGDYQVRTWEGWHHHQTLSLLATWFLTEEARRGKNTDTGIDGAAGAGADRGDARPEAEGPQPRTHLSHHESPPETQRGGTPLPLAPTQTLAL